MLEGLFGKDKKKASIVKVLVVEDDALLSKVLSERLLEEKSFKVVVVDNGLKAVEAIKDFMPDIVLLDLILPGIDGFEVLKQLKADKKTQAIPVAVLSNLSEVGDIKSTKALGADEYFIKANTEMDKIVNYVKKRLKI